QNADSPYLKMHGQDPINWYPWGDEAFEEAKRRNVPVFLSIGYYACHWCHVMHQESFKNAEVAGYLNEHFVAIKVDREERPDIDALYMDAVHILNRNNGGWPASIWLTPDRKPFFAGTYFPPKTRQNRPGFLDLLQQIAQDWVTKSADIDGYAQQIHTRLIKRADMSSSGTVPVGVAQEAAVRMYRGWSPENRGWGTRNQFPMSSNLQFLLWHGAVHHNETSLKIARSQLHAMDQGGIHDHLGGGFHRYTVDPDWRIPHFEKMLYDNAQLLAVYAEASILLEEPRFAQVARDIGHFLINEMQSTDGAFMSSQSADSEGEEGTFYVWTPAQIRAAIPQAEAFINAYGVTDKGNFEEHRNVLIRNDDIDPQSDELRTARANLYEVRAKREHPPTDEKLVVGWNGLAIGGFARAGRLLNEPRFIEAAQRAATHVLKYQKEDGRLPRILANNAPNGVLEDYAFLGEGLLDLYEADGNPTWMKAANSIATAMLDRFLDSKTGGLYQADKDVSLLVRKTDLTDGAEPSGPGRALRLLSRLRSYGSPDIDVETIDQGLSHSAWILERAPNSAATLAEVADRQARQSTEVVIVSPDRDHPILASMLSVFNAKVRPHTVLSVLTPTDTAELSSFAAMIGKEPGENGPRAYVCHDGICKQPSDSLDDFTAQVNSKDH
ncbi:MAG: thioredoxin domain-containing protein, partial [Myxococcota bacterium]